MTKLTIQDKARAALAFSRKPRSFVAPVGHRRLTVNLPEDLHKRLRQAALDKDCNATDIIVALLTQDLA